VGIVKVTVVVVEDIITAFTPFTNTFICELFELNSVPVIVTLVPFAPAFADILVVVGAGTITTGGIGVGAGIVLFLQLVKIEMITIEVRNICFMLCFRLIVFFKSSVLLDLFYFLMLGLTCYFLHKSAIYSPNYIILILF